MIIFIYTMVRKKERVRRGVESELLFQVVLNFDKMKKNGGGWGWGVEIIEENIAKFSKLVISTMCKSYDRQYCVHKLTHFYVKLVGFIK